MANLTRFGVNVSTQGEIMNDGFYMRKGLIYNSDPGLQLVDNNTWRWIQFLAIHTENTDAVSLYGQSDDGPQASHVPQVLFRRQGFTTDGTLNFLFNIQANDGSDKGIYLHKHDDDKWYIRFNSHGFNYSYNVFYFVSS